MIRRIYEAHARAFNGNISFGNGTQIDNIDGCWASATSPMVPDTDFTITHNLGRVPNGFILFSKSGSCDVYLGSVASTKTEMTLRCTDINISLLLFVT